MRDAHSHYACSAPIQIIPEQQNTIVKWYGLHAGDHSHTYWGLGYGLHVCTHRLTSG